MWWRWPMFFYRVSAGVRYNVTGRPQTIPVIKDYRLNHMLWQMISAAVIPIVWHSAMPSSCRIEIVNFLHIERVRGIYNMKRAGQSQNKSNGWQRYSIVHTSCLPTPESALAWQCAGLLSSLPRDRSRAGAGVGTNQQNVAIATAGGSHLRFVRVCWVIRSELSVKLFFRGYRCLLSIVYLPQQLLYASLSRHYHSSFCNCIRTSFEKYRLRDKRNWRRPSHDSINHFAVREQAIEHDTNATTKQPEYSTRANVPFQWLINANENDSKEDLTAERFPFAWANRQSWLVSCEGYTRSGYWRMHPADTLFNWNLDWISSHTIPYSTLHSVGVTAYYIISIIYRSVSVFAVYQSWTRIRR